MQTFFTKFQDLIPKFGIHKISKGPPVVGKLRYFFTLHLISIIIFIFSVFCKI